MKTIFQNHPRTPYVEQFNVNEFKFILLGIMPGYDVFRYTVLRGFYYDITTCGC
jgi:hypothetical protein